MNVKGLKITILLDKKKLQFSPEKSKTCNIVSAPSNDVKPYTSDVSQSRNNGFSAFFSLTKYYLKHEDIFVHRKYISKRI